MLVEILCALLVAFVGFYTYWMTVVVPAEVEDREAEAAVNESPSKKGDRAITTLVDGSSTLVILFGWAGCRDRYLAKYAQYYEQSGVSTIRFTAPIAKIRSFASYRAFAKAFHKNLLTSIPSQKLPRNIYFHTFSMNGVSLFAAFWDYVSKNEDAAKIKKSTSGIIFDSSPAFTSPSQSANAVSFATLPPSSYPSALRESYRAVLFTFFSFHRGVMWLRSLVEKDVYEKHFAYFKMLTFDDLPKKQLYIYGPADLVCSEESIEEFAKTMEARGVATSKLRLLDSLHCQHLRTHPKTYASECLDFVRSGNLPESHSRVALEARTPEELACEEIPEELAMY
ncbi:unnamed protein product [Caenorhabditis auriculariae]|uniref:Transmembrane protein 53 n=1 Tax=Caenorhabditis auriculariae TaxID=2777116 RepID=A0A8S1HH16_9PELO|nr:unnamed protein product [Caenorhabditis auriculariae]